jgi:hypothetical protein
MGAAGVSKDYEGNNPVVYGHRDNGIVDADGLARPCIGANRTYGVDTISRDVLMAMRFPDCKVWQSGRS